MGRNFATGVSWLPGIVVEREGNNVVKIKLDDERIWRRHVDHVIKRKVVTDIESACSRSATSMDLDPPTTPSEEETAAELVPIVDSEATAEETDTEVTAVQEGQPVPTGSQGLRRYSRISRPPDRLQ